MKSLLEFEIVIWTAAGMGAVAGFYGWYIVREHRDTFFQIWKALRKTGATPPERKD